MLPGASQPRHWAATGTAGSGAAGGAVGGAAGGLPGWASCSCCCRRTPFLGAAGSLCPPPPARLVVGAGALLRGLGPHSALLLQVVEVGHFWGYRIDEKNAVILKKLTAEIKRLKLAPLAVHPHPDLVCLAPFADSDERSYFRAQILYVSGSSAEVRLLPPLGEAPGHSSGRVLARVETK